jgi:hypothetical protein
MAMMPLRTPAAARGWTLAEALVALAIALAALALAMAIATRSSWLFGRATGELALVSDARALINNLVADTRAALLVEEPATLAAFAARGRYVVHRPASRSPELRLRRSDADEPGGFGFFSDRETTAQHLDVRRVEYRMVPDPGHPGARRVVRDEQGGFLTRATRGDGRFEYAFSPDRSVPAPAAGAATLASGVTRMEIAPLALVPDPAAPGRRTLVPVAAGEGGGAVRVPAAPGPPAGRLDQTCLVVVNLVLSARGREGPGSEVALATHVWLDEKLLAFRFPEFFSTVDDNLSY